MTSRNLGVGLAVLAASMVSLAGTAFAHTTSSSEEDPPPNPVCVIHSLPSFIAQGERSTAATVADVIEVECNPALYGTNSKIKLIASQLFERCGGHLKWYLPNQPAEGLIPEGFRKSEGIGVSLRLDADGNGTAVVLAGPNCQASQVGEILITAHTEEEPFVSFATGFAVLPPVPTTPG